MTKEGQNRRCKQLRHKIYLLKGKYVDRKHLHSDIHPHPHPHPVVAASLADTFRGCMPLL
jgi:hypothetical protein